LVKRGQRELAAWAKSLNPEEMVMENTGIDWKCIYAALEMKGSVPSGMNC
jgi:hypothetical protein